MQAKALGHALDLVNQTPNLRQPQKFEVEHAFRGCLVSFSARLNNRTWVDGYFLIG